MQAKLQVLESDIATVTPDGIEYICITDVARYKNPDRTGATIGNWLRNRNTIEFLEIWEQLNNSDFKVIEFDDFKKQAGLNRLKGNLRDHANVHLVCLANLESMNAHFISEGLPQAERLVKLNQLAIRQMRVLLATRLPLPPVIGEEG